MPITLQCPRTIWGRAFPVTGAPLVGAPLADPTTVMNEALERVERWAEVACFRTNRPTCLTVAKALHQER
jgi:hypothetical protein